MRKVVEMRKGKVESGNKIKGDIKRKKMKTKRFVGIAIVLGLLFFVALPTTTIAAEDGDLVLGVYGNANEDDTIDMRDLTYVKLIFFGKKPETELADAKYDGKLNPLDFIQIKLIIVGKEKELTIVDSADRIVTVNKPVERIIPNRHESLAVVRSLKAHDRVVGISTYASELAIFYPEFTNLPCVGTSHTPDYEAILELEPDVLLDRWATGGLSMVEEHANKLEPGGVKVLAFNFKKSAQYIEEIKKLGYVLDKEDEAEEYIEFYDGLVSTIKERVAGLSEEDKPRVLKERAKKYRVVGNAQMSYYHSHIVIPGGIDVGADLVAVDPVVDPEWVIVQNPDILIKTFSNWLTGYDVDDVTQVKAEWDEIMNRPELADVVAIKNGRVYMMSGQLQYGTFFICLAYSAKWFHPDLFEDLDPNAYHQEYLARFQGIDYDLDKHGVFVYHPSEHPDGK